MIKLGISGLIIYLAIKNDYDAWGLMLGLTSILFATMIASLMRGQASEADSKKS
jgi:hypothetical protein